MTVHTCTMRVEKVCKVREEPAPRLAAERDALGSHCLECLAASASRDFWGFPEAQWRALTSSVCSTIAPSPTLDAKAMPIAMSVDLPIDDDHLGIEVVARNGKPSSENSNGITDREAQLNSSMRVDP